MPRILLQLSSPYHNTFVFDNRDYSNFEIYILRTLAACYLLHLMCQVGNMSVVFLSFFFNLYKSQHGSILYGYDPDNNAMQIRRDNLFYFFKHETYAGRTDGHKLL